MVREEEEEEAIVSSTKLHDLHHLLCVPPCRLLPQLQTRSCLREWEREGNENRV